MPMLRVLLEGVVLEGHDGEAILDTIRRCGYKVRYGCRQGGCGRCKADLIEGEVLYNARIAESVLSLEERAQGACLPCRAVPLSDVVLSLRGDDHLRDLSPWLLRTHAGEDPSRVAGASIGNELSACSDMST